MKQKIIPLLIFITLIITYLSIFIIEEGEQGIKLPYKNIIYNNNTNQKIIFYPGIHFKIPFIEYIKKNSTLIQTTNINLKKNDKNIISVNYYIKWKIINPFKYHNKIKCNNKILSSLIKKILNKQISNKTNKSNYNYNKTIKNFKYIYITNKYLKNNNISKINNKYFKHLGIKIIDIKINKINLKKKIYYAICKKMEDDQKKIIKKENILSKINTLKIKSYAKYISMKELEKAKKKSTIIKNEGKLQANKIIIKHIKKDPEFYYFIRSLQAYENIFNNKQTNIIILDTNIDFLKYIKKNN